MFLMMKTRLGEEQSLAHSPWLVGGQAGTHSGALGFFAVPRYGVQLVLWPVPVRLANDQHLRFLTLWLRSGKPGLSNSPRTTGGV